MLRAQIHEVNGRSHRKIQMSSQSLLISLAHMFDACLVMCLSNPNRVSLLTVTCPCKNQVCWPFWCPYCAQGSQLKKATGEN